MDVFGLKRYNDFVGIKKLGRIVLCLEFNFSAQHIFSNCKSESILCSSNFLVLEFETFLPLKAG